MPKFKVLITETRQYAVTVTSESEYQAEHDAWKELDNCNDKSVYEYGDDSSVEVEELWNE